MELYLVLLTATLFYRHVQSRISDSVLLNKINEDVKNEFIKVVGNPVTFHPITPSPPSGRRHLEDLCDHKVETSVVKEQPNVAIIGDYYDELHEKIMATVRIPHHIDRHHFEVTPPDLYYTVGPVEAIGFHPTTRTIDECEKIYQDRMGEEYSEESADISEESLEMIRVPNKKAEDSEAAADPLKIYDDSY